MTRDDLDATLASYGVGLEAELSLLRQIDALASQEQQASQSDDLELVKRLSDERTRLMSGLLIVENEIKPLRPIIADHRQQAETLARFDEVVALHRVASRLVNTILSADAQTLGILREASIARKEALSSLEHGGQTLSAYRRVIAPPVSSAALVDRRG